MQNVARHTTALVRKQEQLGSTMFEFGVAFTLLANVSDRGHAVRVNYCVSSLTNLFVTAR